MRKVTQKGFGVVEWVLMGVVVALIGLGGYYAWSKNNESQNTAITNFQECADAGNPVMLSNPPQCVADGVTYYGEDAVEQEESSDQSTNKTETWLVYENDDFGFSFNYPNSWGNYDTFITDYDTNKDEANGGKDLHIDFEKYDESIQITAATVDWYISKGPFETSYLLMTGYCSFEGGYGYGNNPENCQDRLLEGAILKDNKSLYWEEAPGPLNENRIYSYTFNTKDGGLSFRTEKSSDLQLLKQISKTVLTNN